MYQNYRNLNEARYTYFCISVRNSIAMTVTLNFIHHNPTPFIRVCNDLPIGYNHRFSAVLRSVDPRTVLASDNPTIAVIIPR